MLEASDLLATVPALTAQEFEARYALDVYQHPLVNARSHIMMAWHYRSHDKPDQIWFRRLIETELRALQARTLPK